MKIRYPAIFGIPVWLVGTILFFISILITPLVPTAVAPDLPEGIHILAMVNGVLLVLAGLGRRSPAFAALALSAVIALGSVQWSLLKADEWRRASRALRLMPAVYAEELISYERFRVKYRNWPDPDVQREALSKLSVAIETAKREHTEHIAQAERLVHLRRSQFILSLPVSAALLLAWSGYLFLYRRAKLITRHSPEDIAVNSVRTGDGR